MKSYNASVERLSPRQKAHASMTEICPEVHANEIHELFDKVSPNLNSHENTHNSVKHKVI